MDVHAELWCRSACAPSYEAQKDSLLMAVLHYWDSESVQALPKQEIYHLKTNKQK